MLNFILIILAGGLIGSYCYKETQGLSKEEYEKAEKVCNFCFISLIILGFLSWLI